MQLHQTTTWPLLWGRQPMCSTRDARWLTDSTPREGLGQPKPSFLVSPIEEAQWTMPLLIDITISCEEPCMTQDIMSEPIQLCYFFWRTFLENHSLDLQS